MKYIVSALLLASLSAFGMMAIAEQIESPPSDEYGETVSQIILQRRSVLSGLVSETKEGIVITTTRGTFFLKGKDLDEFVGKNVWVTGVVRDRSVFPITIDGEL